MSIKDLPTEIINDLQIDQGAADSKGESTLVPSSMFEQKAASIRSSQQRQREHMMARGGDDPRGETANENYGAPFTANEYTSTPYGI